MIQIWNDRILSFCQILKIKPNALSFLCKVWLLMLKVNIYIFNIQIYFTNN